MIQFILGIVFTSLIIPVLEALAAAILTGLEVIKGKWSIKIADYNHQLQQFGEEKEIRTNVIGFAIPTEEDDCDEY